jgi:aminoglycoside phosphotransferase (APT) family kinase protein
MTSAARLRDALPRVLMPVLGGVTAENVRALTGGASRSTWAFEAVTSDARRRLILRTGPPDEVHASMEVEAQTQKLAAAAGAPVPHIVVADNSTAMLGLPYLICDFIDGETIAPRILRTLGDSDSDGAVRTRLLEQCASALAAIHSVNPADAELREQDQMAVWREQLDGFGDTTATFVHAGEIYEDLAWFCIRAWRFGAPPSRAAGGLGNIDRFLSFYERASGTTVDRVGMRWWLVRATLSWGIICRYQAERHLSGQTRSVELAAIGRRVCETEWDLLDLLETA